MNAMKAGIGLAALFLPVSPAWGRPQQPDPVKVDAAIKAGVENLRTKVRKQPAATEKMRELVLLTLAHSGLRAGDPLFDELLKSILDEPLATTYRTSLQAMLLEEVDRATHQDRLFQCAQFLVDNQCKNGQWSYGAPTTYPEPPVESPGWDAATGPAVADPRGRPPVRRKIPVRKQREGPDTGDNSNSQYAALGLRACHDAGIILPKEMLQKAARWWRENQYGESPAGTAVAPRGWSYGPRGNTPYGSMTAGAVGALVLCDHLLGADWRKDDAVNSGMNWLRDNFTVTENPKRHGQHHYYFLYALERACRLYPTETLGKAEWYPEGAIFLLRDQVRDGSWGKSPVDTCFAILFLRRATRPLLDPKEMDRKR